MFCDITMPDGSPSWADSRHVLRRQLAKASDLGFSCYVHPEIEFFLLKPGPDDGSVPVPADNGGYFDQAVHDAAPNFRRHAIDALEQMGISVEFSHHEGAPGQQEIDLRYADALSMADNVMTFRYVVKEVALGDGVRASFMPKPFAEYPGSAMHTHMSLFEGETNAFHTPDDPLQLSDVGKAFIAGILEHASEISAVTNQWVNSYKRLVHGGEAPTAASWGAANRSALVRVPMYTPRKASSRRVEVRSPDSACNPYLTFAVLLAAGLRGVEKGYVLGPQAEDNVWTLTPEERRAMGYRELPGSLGAALAAMESLRAGRGSVGGARIRLLPAQQAHRMGELPQSRHTVRTEGLPFAVTGGPSPGSACATVVGVAKPATQRPKLPSVGRLGLVEPTAARRIWTGSAGTPMPTSNCSGRCPRAADADTALRAMVRLADAAGNGWDELNRALVKDRGLRGRLFGMVGSSLALGDHLIAHPQSWHLLAGQVTLPSAKELRDAFAEIAEKSKYTDTRSAVQPLREYYRDRLMVLAALDLASTVENEPVLPFTTVGAHLSDLADAALGAALTVASRSVSGKDVEPPRLAVIAMGKCGARELNYVSDVDIIFVADAATDSNLALATRVAGEMMRFASETFFEVDAALRPEGKHGQLVRTLESHIAYYNRWAKTWEFQALLKARPAAGDTELGEQYIDALMPMVWTACEREDFVPEVQAMRRRVEQLVPAGVRAREIKLGTGGLRDVEFAVQLLQLVHGRNDESLHVASTVDALAALGAGGYVGRDDAANMTASYEFLRLLEHRLQLQRLKRTHMLPETGDDEAMRWLARAAHVRPDGRHDALGCAARRAQAAKPAGVEAARQALLPAAAGVGWSTGAWPFGGYDPRGRRTSARRTGI